MGPRDPRDARQVLGFDLPGKPLTVGCRVLRGVRRVPSEREIW